MKIVVNKCYGEFSLSNKAKKRYLELNNIECYFYRVSKIYAYKMVYEIINDIYNCENTSDIICSTNYLGEETDISVNKYIFDDNDIDRLDSNLVKVIEELGEEANTSYSNLQVIEIPDDVKFEINDYDGFETIHEIHRIW